MDIGIVQSLFTPSNNVLILEAFLNGNSVASDTLGFDTFSSTPVISNLSISGTRFDSLTLRSTIGPDPFTDLIAFGVDNISANIAQVPEPSTWVMMLLVSAGLFGARRKV